MTGRARWAVVGVLLLAAVVLARVGETPYLGLPYTSDEGANKALERLDSYLLRLTYQALVPGYFTYLSSGSTAPATSGFVRMGSADTVSVRNTGNTADLVGVTALTGNIIGINTAGGSGVAISSVPFSLLGTPTASFLYCSDCLAASDPCTGSSTGTFAFRIAVGGTPKWKCL